MQQAKDHEVDGFYCDVDERVYAADSTGREWCLDLDGCSTEVARRASAAQERADQAMEIAMQVQVECRVELLELCRAYGVRMVPSAPGMAG